MNNSLAMALIALSTVVIGFGTISIFNTYPNALNVIGFVIIPFLTIIAIVANQRAHYSKNKITR